ncbi:MAG: hypothetical protein AAGK71_12020 [Pseudomonadota bacterium]
MPEHMPDQKNTIQLQAIGLLCTPLDFPPLQKMIVRRALFGRTGPKQPTVLIDKAAISTDRDIACHTIGALPKGCGQAALDGTVESFVV